jgi:hypothetical protein
MKLIGRLLLTALLSAAPLVLAAADGLPLAGNRYLTLATVVRVRQIETTRDKAEGPDESGVQTPVEAKQFRETIARAWPGAKITWAFS